MTPVVPQRARTARNAFASLLAGAALLACGGGTGTQQDSGANKTYLSVQASDADGDTLQYQWRVTAGTIDNRNSPQAVWTMPDGPGLHFAYVTVTDGRGGSTEQQYAVATDTLGTTVPDRPALDHTPPAVTEADGFAVRLRFEASGAGLATQFADPAAAPGAALVPRTVYLADVQVTLRDPNGQVLFAGLSDLGGEVALPHLPALTAPQKYSVQCATSADAPQQPCDSFNPQLDGVVRVIVPAHTDARNLRLFGHVALADGGLCGDRNEFFGTQAVAQVQLQATDGTLLSAPLRVNRFGDYALDAAVSVDTPLQLKVTCTGYTATVAVAPPAGGFAAATPVDST